MALASVSFRDRVTVTIPEAIAALGVGRDIVYREIEADRLRVVQLGERTMVTVESLLSLPGTLAKEKARDKKPRTERLSDSFLAEAIKEYVSLPENGGHWAGTASDLFTVLLPQADSVPTLSASAYFRRWFSAQTLGAWLTRNRSLLTRHGIEMQRFHSGIRTIEFSVGSED
jgi:hypothetical protein